MSETWKTEQTMAMLQAAIDQAIEANRSGRDGVVVDLGTSIDHARMLYLQARTMIEHALVRRFEDRRILLATPGAWILFGSVQQRPMMFEGLRVVGYWTDHTVVLRHREDAAKVWEVLEAGRMDNR